LLKKLKIKLKKIKLKKKEEWKKIEGWIGKKEKQNIPMELLNDLKFVFSI
jgi:hypothetical protein